MKDADVLMPFTDSHPAVMHKRINEKNWEANFNLTKTNLSVKDRLLYNIEKITGRRIFDYRNYKII